MRCRNFVTACTAVWVCSLVTTTAQHAVSGIGERRTIECRGQDATVTGSQNEVNLRGECPRVDVNGTGNTIIVEATARIEVTGTGNRVTWQRAINRKTPRVSNTGVNSVQQAKDKDAERSDSKSQPLDSSGAAAAPDSRSQEPLPPPPAGESSTQSDQSSAKELTVLTDNKVQTIHCRGRRIRVTGTGNRLTLRGDCPQVDVTGDRNILSIEVSTQISLPGSDNEITWIRSAGGAEPRLSATGERNRVIQAR